MRGEKGGRAPLSQSQVLERAMISWTLDKNPCFSTQSLPPVLLGSHDTGGSAAGHLTPPATVDVDHNDVTRQALPSLLFFCSEIVINQQIHTKAHSSCPKYLKYLYLAATFHLYLILDHFL